MFSFRTMTVMSPGLLMSKEKTYVIYSARNSRYPHKTALLAFCLWSPAKMLGFSSLLQLSQSRVWKGTKKNVREVLSEGEKCPVWHHKGRAIKQKK